MRLTRTSTRRAIPFRGLVGRVLAGISVFLVWGLLPAVHACVGCREPGTQTLNHESPTAMAGVGFSWSVLFMLIFAISLVGLLSFYIWQTCLRLERERAHS